ncbi:MAG: SMC-Scp complex subunit ScpB [Phycisphaerae bacterium]|nr:SMC-Scp complex subunit ScpB [Phycisphaerae bacterium]
MSAKDAALAEAAATVEAILFASDCPLTPAKIAQVAEAPGQGLVRQAIETLNARYEQAGCAFRIEHIAGGYQMLTLPQYHDVLSRLLRAHSDSRLSQAAMETLAIVAYRQPILRADVEAIRGVACGEVLRGLLEKQLVKIVGRAEVLGRPMLYGTTRRFLEVFGLSSLTDLPRVEELRSGATESAGKTAPAASAEGQDDDSAPETQRPTSSELEGTEQTRDGKEKTGQG